MQGERWHELRNILVVRADNSGDVVLTSPALRALRAAAPAARITLLASPAGSQAAPLLRPWLDAVLVRRVLWQDVHGALAHDPGRELALVDDVRARAFDAAFFLTSFSQSPLPPAYVCYLAGVPIRVGQATEHGGALLTHGVKPPPFETHQAERNLHLLASAGIAVAERHLELVIPAEDEARARALLEARGIAENERFALVVPGASAEARRYDPARFGAAAALLAARAELPVVVAGSERERETIRPALDAAGDAVVSLVGETSVPELAALTRRAALVLACNSLALHLADAFVRPLVVLYSGTDYEEQWRPRRSRARLLRLDTVCSPCFELTCPYGKECLAIEPAEVVAAALAVVSPEPALVEETA